MRKTVATFSQHARTLIDGAVGVICGWIVGPEIVSGPTIQPFVFASALPRKPQSTFRADALQVPILVAECAGGLFKEHEG